MKTVIFWRHAKSAWSDSRLNDHDRPLNGRGERSAKAIADHLARKGPSPGLILCSTALRTRQTLEPLLKQLSAPAPPISLERDLYLASEARLLDRLQTVADSVSAILLIGHNEGIGDLATALAGRGPAGLLASLQEKYPTGALATLRVPDGPWRELARGSGELLAFVRRGPDGDVSRIALPFADTAKGRQS